MLLTKEEKALRNAEFAKNYPFITEGLNQPITVGNINEYDGRTIVNLCAKLKGEVTNASISYPSHWAIASRFKTGEIIMVQVLDGKVFKLCPPSVNTIGKRSVVSASSVNDQVEEKSNLDKATDEVKNVVDKALAKETVAEPVVAGADEDMPF